MVALSWLIQIQLALCLSKAHILQFSKDRDLLVMGHSTKEACP